MNKAQEAKRNEIAGNFGKQIGVNNVEMTIRGLKSFTFSFEGKNEVAVEKAIEMYKPISTVTSAYDEELDMSFIWIESK